MNSMEQEFASVAANAGEMRQTLLLVNESIGVMPALDSSVHTMDTSLAGLNTAQHAMVERIRYMNASVAGMASSVQTMNNLIKNMNPASGNMAENSHRLSKPMKAFTCSRTDTQKPVFH